MVLTYKKYGTTLFKKLTALVTTKHVTIGNVDARLGKTETIALGHKTDNVSCQGYDFINIKVFVLLNNRCSNELYKKKQTLSASHLNL